MIEKSNNFFKANVHSDIDSNYTVKEWTRSKHSHRKHPHHPSSIEPETDGRCLLHVIREIEQHFWGSTCIAILESKHSKYRHFEQLNVVGCTLLSCFWLMGNKPGEKSHLRTNIVLTIDVFSRLKTH